MKSQSTNSLSPFGQSAVALDGEFIQLEELSGQIERLGLESESGMERARLLLTRFSESSQRIGDRLQAMAKALEESRARAEKAAEAVAARAAVIQERQNVADQMFGRFQTLGQMVHKVTDAVVQIQKPANGELSAEEKALLIKHMPELDSKLEVLITEARKLKQDAQAEKMKTLEKNADSLSQSLNAARGKLNLVVERFLALLIKSPSDNAILKKMVSGTPIHGLRPLRACGSPLTLFSDGSRLRPSGGFLGCST